MVDAHGERISHNAVKNVGQHCTSGRQLFRAVGEGERPRSSLGAVGFEVGLSQHVELGATVRRVRDRNRWCMS